MPKTPPLEATGAIDPITFARFLVLPRAVELLEAFAAIPPGRLRDTIVEHAHALAEAHNAAPPQYRAPDPLPAALGLPSAPKALPRRTEHEPKTTDPYTKAVQMALDGVLPFKIAEATGLSVHQVYNAKSRARAAGVNFPKTPKAKQGQAKGHGTGRFVYLMEDLTSPQQISSSAKAAEKRGITLEAYMGRRRIALEMGLAGEHIRTIMDRTQEDRMVLTSWFSAARQAGHPVPYMLDAAIGHFEEKPPVDLAAERKKRANRTFIMSAADAGPKGLAMVDKAAATLGLDRQGYFDLRARALTLYQGGKHPSEVSNLLKISPKQASNWRERAIAAGLLKRAASA